MRLAAMLCSVALAAQAAAQAGFPAYESKYYVLYTDLKPDDVPAVQKEHPLERFGNEARRLVRVLADRLESREFVCDSFSIADIALYPWVRGWKWSKVDITDQPNVMEWIERVRARPGVGRGLEYGVPKGEVDQWSEDRKAQYRKSGASIAANERIAGERD